MPEKNIASGEPMTFEEYMQDDSNPSLDTIPRWVYNLWLHIADLLNFT